MDGVALLVLARVERNVALLLFTLAYLALVLLVLPMDDGWASPNWGTRAALALPQVVVGAVLLLGAAAFAKPARFAAAAGFVKPARFAAAAAFAKPARFAAAAGIVKGSATARRR